MMRVKCTLVQALRLCTGRTAHRGSRGTGLLFLDHGTIRGEGSASRPGRSLPPSGPPSPVPIVQEAGWPPGPVWTDAENFAPTGIRSPDRPARSQSLYRLSYPAHMMRVGPVNNLNLLLYSCLIYIKYTPRCLVLHPPTNKKPYTGLVSKRAPPEYESENSMLAPSSLLCILETKRISLIGS